MNHRSGSNYIDDRERFEEIKTEFDLLKKAFYDIHEEWKKLHDEPPDEQHRSRHDELIDRESALHGELRDLLVSADEILGRALGRSP